MPNKYAESIVLSSNKGAHSINTLKLSSILKITLFVSCAALAITQYKNCQNEEPETTIPEPERENRIPAYIDPTNVG